MGARIHGMMGAVALLTIGTFFTSTIAVELFGNPSRHGRYSHTSAEGWRREKRSLVHHPEFTCPL